MIVNGYSQSSSRSSELYPVAEDGSKEASQSKKQLPGKQKFPQYTRHGAGGRRKAFQAEHRHKAMKDKRSSFIDPLSMCQALYEY